MSYDQQLESTARFEYFEDFKSEMLKQKNFIPSIDYDDLSEAALNSKSILGPISPNVGKDGIQVKDLLAGLDVVVYGDCYKKAFWSEMAAELDDKDAEYLIDALNKYFERNSLSDETIAELTLTFALKNEDAWQEYSQHFFERNNISAMELLYALRFAPRVKEEFIPLMHKILGKEFSDLYIENKELIDKTPRKQNLLNLLTVPRSQRANFLDYFTKKLEKLTTDFGENEYDFYCISNALKKEGFLEAAHKLFAEVMTNKNSFIRGSYNEHSNAFVRGTFPDLAAQVDEAFPIKISREQLEAASKKSFHEARILREAALLPEFKDCERQLLIDSVKAGVRDIDELKEVVRLFYKFNERSIFYGSRSDTVYPNVLIPLLRGKAPEWMYPIVAIAVNSQVISPERLGSVKNLFDAAKAWQMNPLIPKKDAEKIGRMPLESRMVAGAIFTRLSKRLYTPRSQLSEDFWHEMKKAQDMGWKNAIFQYCYDNAETRGRVITLYHPELGELEQRVFRSCVHFRDLLTCDTKKINHIFDLWEEYLQISRENILGKISKYIEERFDPYNMYKPLVKRLFAFDKIFPDEKDKIDYLESVKHLGKAALLCLPSNLKDEKYASLAEYFKKNMFFVDENGKRCMRAFDGVSEVTKIWNDLTPQQEQFNFGKILGICYTKDSVQRINYHFSDFLDINKFSQIPNNLRLYQKMLVSEFEPQTTAALNMLLSLNRDEGMKKLFAIAEQNGWNDKQLRILVDLTIGNDANINNFEREQIAQLPLSHIAGFRSKLYQGNVDKIMSLLALDPKAAELFRKHFCDMDASNVSTQDEKILKIRAYYLDNKYWIVHSAINAMNCFGNDFNRYLQKISKYNKEQKDIYDKSVAQGVETPPLPDIINIHDALYWLPNDISEKQRPLFMKLIDKHLFYSDGKGVTRHRPWAEFEAIGKSWCNLSPEERDLSYKDLLCLIQSKIYKDAQYLVFAQEAARWGINDQQYKNLEKIYEQGLQVPELIDPSQRFPYGNLIGRFVPRDDPRTGFFGKWTNCCQHFDGAGRSCAISSIRDPFSQLFVVEKEDGTIVAGSWVWESKFKKDNKYFKALCFDNIEAIGDYNHSQTVTEVYKATLPYLAQQNYAKVMVGMGYQDGNVDEFPYDESPVPINKNYSGYTDARTQKLMLFNPDATPVDYNDGDIYIAGALEEDIANMQEVCRRCFPEGDRDLQIPSENAQGLVLKDQDKVVGYVLWSEKEHSIYDMAVLPEYRKDKNASSFKLLNETVKRLKKIGGEWTAELRDNTSLRYMKAMAGRGLVNLEVGALDHTMSDGSKVYQVKFSAKEETQQNGNVIPPNFHGRNETQRD